MQKERKKKWPLKKIALIALPVVMLAALAVMARGLLGKEKPAVAEVEEAAPVAQNQSILVYEGIPYDGNFSAPGAEGKIVFALQTEPKVGNVTITEGTAAFRYIPKEGKKGADAFTFVAIDSEGRVSQPATVSVEILPRKCNVTYEDMGDSPVQTAAIRLTEEGIFTGTKVGEDYFFEPERAVSRSEFLTMAMKATGREILSDVTVTGFSDDSEIPSWAKGAAASAVQQGLLDDTMTVFGANTPMTMGEAAVLLDRMMCLTDAPSTGDDAQQAMANLASVGVCLGSSTVEKGVCRAEAAQMLSDAMTAMETAPTGFWTFLD
jgi:hypothetical protein